ncbi:hypothetical protein, partial [Klebsiella pneumoniae]|uniref:hypothetical protein n=1 Tax=Klebsiella pneumoniae TaxID=573 RepID=UPI002B23936E
QNDVTLKMPAFEWVHVQLHQQKGMISLSPPTICNSAKRLTIPSTGRQNAAHFGSLRCAPALVTSNVSTTETQLYLAHVYSNGI